MSFPFRVINIVLQVITTLLEINALDADVHLINSFCVKGGEYGVSLWLHLFIFPALATQSLLFAVFRICYKSSGLDPVALAFNLTGGIICIATSITLLVALRDHCGNKNATLFYETCVCGIIAGILHLLNACICNTYMPVEEAFFTKPAKSSRHYRRRTLLNV